MMNVLSVSVLYLSLVLSSYPRVADINLAWDNSDSDLVLFEEDSPSRWKRARLIENEDIIEKDCTTLDPTDLDDAEGTSGENDIIGSNIGLSQQEEHFNAEAISGENDIIGSNIGLSRQEELALYQIAYEFVSSEGTSEESADKPKQNEETTYTIEKLHEDISGILYNEFIRKGRNKDHLGKEPIPPTQVREIFNQALETFFQLTGLIFPYKLYENALIYFKDLLLGCDLPNDEAESILRNFLISLTLQEIRKEEYRMKNRDLTFYNKEYLRAVQKARIKIIEDYKGVIISKFALVNRIAVPKHKTAPNPKEEPYLEEAKEIVKKIIEEIINKISCLTVNNQNEYNKEKTIDVLKLISSLVELPENALKLFKDPQTSTTPLTPLTPVLEIYDFIHLQENFQKKKENFEKSAPNPQKIIEFNNATAYFLKSFKEYIEPKKDSTNFFENFFKGICTIDANIMTDNRKKKKIDPVYLTACLENIKGRYDLFRRVKDEIVTAPMKERLLRLLHLLIFQLRVFGKLFSKNYDWEKGLSKSLRSIGLTEPEQKIQFDQKMKVICSRTNSTLFDFYQVKEPLIKEKLLNPAMTSIKIDNSVPAALATAANKEFLDIKSKYIDEGDFPYLCDIKNTTEEERKYSLRLIYSLITEYDFVLPLLQLRSLLLKLHSSHWTAWSENAKNSENLKNITIILYNRLCDYFVIEDSVTLKKIGLARVAKVLNREFSNFLPEKDNGKWFSEEGILLTPIRLLSNVDKYLVAREISSSGQVKAPNRTQRSKKCTRRGSGS